MKKINNKGYVFAFEAIITLMLFCLAISFLTQTRAETTIDLLVLQKENDLLKVWSYDLPSEGELLVDTQKVLGEKFFLKINEKILKNNSEGKNCIASSGKILNKTLNYENIEIKVCFD